MTLLGRHDTGFANLRLAAEAGRRRRAIGYLNTDWGDGGHPQPLAVSYAPYLLGASVSWCAASFEQKRLVPMLNRDVFHDATQRIAKAATALGFAHRKFGYREPNVTPYGGVIAAPRPETRELFCRSGLKYYARIAEKNIRAALAEVEKQRAVLRRARPSTKAAGILRTELDLAARMAAQSCKIMLWSRRLPQGRWPSRCAWPKRAWMSCATLSAISMPTGRRETRAPAKCSAFIQWRMHDYRGSVLHFPPEAARVAPQNTNPAE